MLEELEHAKARGAHLRRGGGRATSDGHTWWPSGEGAVRCMRMALKDVKVPIDSSIRMRPTDRRLREIEAIREAFGQVPADLGDRVAHRHRPALPAPRKRSYSLLMMNNGFICESANIENLDPRLQTCDHAQAS